MGIKDDPLFLSGINTITMATLDPRSQLQENCPPNSPEPGINDKREFFQNLGKFGDLEILNHVDGNIGKGLRVLGAISEGVRTNVSVIPVKNADGTFSASGQTVGIPSIINSTAADVLDAGADFVLDTVGITTQQVSSAASFNPGVANRALGQAKSVFESVKNGNFDSFDDLPTAVAEFANLEKLVRSIFNPAARKKSELADLCASSYAQDLIALAPKHKFMFIVEFLFNDPYSGLSNKEFAFVIKRSTRPQVIFDYEDVNLYNFRTKVLKRTEYQPMSMVFYDDIQDKILEFYESYLKAVSPIARIDPQESAGGIGFDERGMDFALSRTDISVSLDALPELITTPADPNAQFSASASTLAPASTGSTPLTVIRQINIFHLLQAGRFVDRYSFSNPRITELSLDDLDMTDSGEGNEMSIAFTYDNVFIESNIEMAEEKSRLKELTEVGAFPLDPVLD